MKRLKMQKKIKNYNKMHTYFNIELLYTVSKLKFMKSIKNKKISYLKMFDLRRL